MILIDRRYLQSITINQNILIKVVEIGQRHVRLGIKVPGNLPVIRTEDIYRKNQTPSCPHCQRADQH